MDGIFDAGDAQRADSIAASSSHRSIFPSWNEADDQGDAPPQTRQRAHSRTSHRRDNSTTHRHRSHSRRTSDGFGGSVSREQTPAVADFPQQSNEDEVEGYLPPMNGPSRRPRQRFDSVGSWGSSVMPAALPVRKTEGGYASHRSHKAARQQQQQQDQAAAENHIRHTTSQSTGLENWLSTTSRLTVPQNEHPSAYRLAAPPSPQHSHHQFQSFAPSGRVRRLDSDAASAAEGSVGGWSTGIRSTGGRRHKKGSIGRDVKQGRSRPPLWEGDAAVLHERREDEPPSGADLNSVLQWRQSSAIPPEGSQRRQHSTEERLSNAPSRRRHAATGSTRAGSVTESVLPASMSLQSIRRRDQVSVPPIPSVTRTSTDQKPSDTPLRTFVRGMMKEGLSARTIVGLALAMSVLSKWALGAGGGWTGQARIGWDTVRHWMALTLHLPVEEWYTFDVDHELLTRPPMTAWWSLLQAKLATMLFPHLASQLKFPPPSSTSSSSSASSSSAASMQTFLVISHIFTVDLLYIIPVLLFLSRRLKDRGRRTKAIASASVLLQPALILVDYGLGDTRSLALGCCAASLAMFYTTLPNPDGDAGSDEETTRKTRIASLSRQVSTSYVIARALFAVGVLFDQSLLLFAPVVAALVIGRLIGLASVKISRGLTFLNWINGISIFATAWPLLPWLIPLVFGQDLSTALSPLRDMLNRLMSGAQPSSGDATPLVLLMPGVKSASLSASTPTPTLLERLNAEMLHGRLNIAQVPLMLTGFLCLWPCLILYRAAKETVLIENFLHEGVAASNSSAPALSSSQPKSTSALDTPRKSEVSVSVKSRKSAGTKLAGAAPSEAGSDLRSFAESIVRGGPAVEEGPGPVQGQLKSGDEDEEEGERDDDEAAKGRARTRTPRISSSCPSPSAAVLPYVSCAIGLCIWLFSAVVFSPSSILFPLLPFTLLLVAKGDSWGGGSYSNDWDWSMLMNNVSTFSLWPSVRANGLQIQYVVTVFTWNWLLGYRPFSGGSPLRSSGGLARAVHWCMAGVHVISLVDSITGGVPSRVVSVETLVKVVSTAAFVVIWIWSIKRIAEVALGNGLPLGVFAWGSGGSGIKRR